MLIFPNIPVPLCYNFIDIYNNTQLLKKTLRFFAEDACVGIMIVLFEINVNVHV